MKKLFIAILFVTLSLVAAGCSKAGDESIKAASDLKDKNKPDAKAQNNSSENNKNIGVIADTVADVFKEPSVQSPRLTQALFNQTVTILDTRENWTQVKVQDGYTGWIKSKFLERDASSANASDYEYRLIITSKTKSVFSQAKAGAVIKEVVMGTEVFIINKSDSWYQIALPGKTSGWINESGTIRIASNEHIPKTSSADLAATASKLKGSVYMLGGMSGMGIDSSGLTYICCRINGVDIPREAEKQYAFGQNVEKKADAIKQGDLLFFSTQEDLKDIALVGIYIGNNQFIHASKSKGSVTNGNLNDNFYKSRLVGIKRLFEN